MSLPHVRPRGQQATATGRHLCAFHLPKSAKELDLGLIATCTLRGILISLGKCRYLVVNVLRSSLDIIRCFSDI